MSDGSHIEWTDASWSPLRARRADGQPNKGGGGWACQRVSPGCEHCYAETLNKRLGTGLAYNAAGIAASEHYLDARALEAPLRWTRPRRVFLSSMTDVFGEWVPDDYLDRLFAVMALTPQHTYQVLTKRAERMREYLTTRDTAGAVAITIREVAPDGGIAAMKAMGTHVLRDVVQRRWPLPNVWLGVSAEDQQRADERIPELLATPAAVRFVSYEPALGPVNMAWAMDRQFYDSRTGKDLPALDWVIVGGESGPGARPFDIAWARSMVQQCQDAGVAVFVKQLGAKPFTSDMAGEAFPFLVERVPRATGGTVGVRLTSRKGGDPGEWPADLRVREFPI
jgi:protein gp37